jgi:hypothetical protein
MWGSRWASRNFLKAGLTRSVWLALVMSCHLHHCKVNRRRLLIDECRVGPELARVATDSVHRPMVVAWVGLAVGTCVQHEPVVLVFEQIPSVLWASDAVPRSDGVQFGTPAKQM